MTDKKDSVAIYLKEISRIKLLTADEEIKLARLVRELLKLERVNSQLKELLNKNPTESQWAKNAGISVRQLRHRLDIGRQAKNQMVSANLRLVVSIAKKYLNRGVSFEDLIQEGTLGLIKAVEKFDPELGYKFSTYATWWVKQALSRAVTTSSRTIRLPGHINEKINLIQKTVKSIHSSLGRQPTEEEIAAAMEITVDKLRFIIKSAQPITSLDKPVGKEENTTIGELIAAENELIEENLLLNFLNGDLNMALDLLEDSEAKVLRLRYGIDNGSAKTVDEVGKILNFTSEKIRKIEAKAFRKLRHPNCSKALKEYIT